MSNEYQDIKTVYEELNKVMKPMNLSFWKELQEDGGTGMSGMGAAPTPALGQVASSSGCTVNGIPVAGESQVFKKKKKKSKKNEDIEDLTSEIQQDLSDIVWTDEENKLKIRALLSKAQGEENDAIQSYLDKALECEKMGVPTLAKLFRELADDETTHTGCIQGAMDNFGVSDLEKVIDGQVEAEEILSESTMNEISKELKDKVSARRAWNVSSAEDEFRAIDNEHTAELDKIASKYTDEEILAGKADAEVDAVDAKFAPAEEEAKNKLDIARKKLERNIELRKNEALEEVTPEEMLDEVDATFSPHGILQTIIQNHRELIRVSVYYTNPEDRALTYTIKLEWLDEITEDVIDEVIEADLTIEDCISLLSDLFRRYKYVEAENFDESHPRYIKDYDHKTQEFKVGDRVNTEDGDGTVERVSTLNDGDYWYEVRLDNDDRFIPCYGWELRKPEEDFNESHSRYKKDYDHKTQQFEIGDKVNIEDGDGTIARIDTMNDGDYWYEVELEDGRYVPCYGWEIERLDEDFNEAYERITDLIAKKLDKMNFEFANTNDIIYKKEGDFKYLFKFDNELGLIRIKVLKDNLVLEEKQWEVNDDTDIEPIFEEIENIYNKYGI